LKRLLFTVTNDLNYDQRMIRICRSLAPHYKVTLVGRKLKGSLPLQSQPFLQKRLGCFFSKGKMFYLEYNLRLFFFLLFKKTDLVCAIDLDTILPVYYVSKIKKLKRVYDAHELFCEMKEVVSRPRIYKAWKRIERSTVPKFNLGYTVNRAIADEFKKMFGVNYAVIQNCPVLEPLSIPKKKEKIILYQGAVNEGRSFETLIPAFRQIDASLIIAGSGNFLKQSQELVRSCQLEDKIFFTGQLLPRELTEFTLRARRGITLFENTGLSNYYSLANRFFDYIHAGLPQLCVDYPCYREINEKFDVAILITDLSPQNIADNINRLLNDGELYARLQQNCLKARNELNWQQEEIKLLSFYRSVFQDETN
jgi:glycosyltransferase involved in cell wall biosynthesis